MDDSFISYIRDLTVQGEGENKRKLQETIKKRTKKFKSNIIQRASLGENYYKFNIGIDDEASLCALEEFEQMGFTVNKDYIYNDYYSTYNQDNVFSPNYFEIKISW